MARLSPSFTHFSVHAGQAIRVVLTAVKGSSPREQGTQMFVAHDMIWGTIGGGQLEYMAIDHARMMLKKGIQQETLNIPLGPEIGQCCGGHVTADLVQMTCEDMLKAQQLLEHIDQQQPHIYIMGAGHVGQALAQQLQHQPVTCILIDTRPTALSTCDADVEKRCSALPEADILNAPSGSAFVVLTHDHALDFLLTSAALGRTDAAYVGMIGSATKRAKLANWCHEHCQGQLIDNLHCPIGKSASDDKRPAVIAAFVVAEIMSALTVKPKLAQLETSPH